jgi:hypothetical protein
MDCGMYIIRPISLQGFVLNSFTRKLLRGDKIQL